MNDVSYNNKRIAKNTLILYVRMILITLLSLITIKYTLQILGVDDFGIYNLLGGIVSFLSFITATISSATQRFLAFELGRKDIASYNNVFNMLLLIFGGISMILLFIFILMEHPIIYLWLKIPGNRLHAAEIVYYFSVFSFITSVIAIPYISSIVANEKMDVYAYVAIIDTIAKLLLLIALVISPFDKLITLAIGTFFVTLVTNSIYVLYSKKKIKGTNFYLYWEYNLFLKLMSYTGWSFFGSVSSVLCNQGISIIMNLFFGVTANAAKAISDKIMSMVQSFVMNFYIAVSPQITKTYANNNLSTTINLAFKSSRLGYYLMLIISVPIIILLDKILSLWLSHTYTQDMLIFTRLSLIFALINVFESPITFMIRATGNIKKYQISVGFFTLAIFPITYLLYKIGFPAYTAFWCEITIYAIVQLIRVKIASKFYPITIKKYIKEVLEKPLIISTITYIISIILETLQFNILIKASIVFFLMLIMIWFYGLHSNEQKFVLDTIKKRNYIYGKRKR